MGKALDPALMFDFVNQDVTSDYYVYRKPVRKTIDKKTGAVKVESAEAMYYKVRSGDTLSKIAAAFADPTIDGTYADIRFVHSTTTTSDCNLIRKLPTVRYCSGKRFHPWMFRFGTQTAHPSTFFRKECFAKWGDYSLDYGMYGDFELLCRFIWKNKAKMKYLPMCTTVMRMGGASTNGWRTTLKINRSDLRALKANGCWSCLPLLYSRYLLKIWGFIFISNPFAIH
jgi:hypothetical protein